MFVESHDFSDWLKRNLRAPPTLGRRAQPVSHMLVNAHKNFFISLHLSSNDLLSNDTTPWNLCTCGNLGLFYFSFAFKLVTKPTEEIITHVEENKSRTALAILGLPWVSTSWINKLLICGIFYECLPLLYLAMDYLSVLLLSVLSLDLAQKPQSSLPSRVFVKICGVPCVAISSWSGFWFNVAQIW